LIRVKPAFWEAIDCAALDSIVWRVAYTFLSSVHGKRKGRGGFTWCARPVCFLSTALRWFDSWRESGILVLFEATRDSLERVRVALRMHTFEDSHH
jgi:hypothetical protein